MGASTTRHPPPATYGGPQFTNDAGLWLRDTPANIERATEALERFGAPPNVISALQEAEGLDVVWMGMPPQRIDLMLAVPSGDFDRAWRDRASMVLDGATVHVVSKTELIRLKRASGGAIRTSSTRANSS